MVMWTAVKKTRVCGQHATTPRTVGIYAPPVAVGDPQVGLHAAEHRGRLHEIVERNIVTQPSAVAEESRIRRSLEVDAGDQVRQIPLQLGIGIGAAEQCRGQWRCPSVYIRYGCDQEVHRFLVLSDGQESSADVEIEDVLLAGDAECGVLDGGDEEGSLGPLSLDGFGGYTGCRSDFRQRGTCVPRSANSSAAASRIRDRVASACC